MCVYVCISLGTPLKNIPAYASSCHWDLLFSLLQYICMFIPPLYWTKVLLLWLFNVYFDSYTFAKASYFIFELLLYNFIFAFYVFYIFVKLHLFTYFTLCNIFIASISSKYQEFVSLLIGAERTFLRLYKICTIEAPFFKKVLKLIGSWCEWSWNVMGEAILITTLSRTFYSTQP